MSPATIRSWISKGTLRAMRPGKRKLLVRRSELDRMLRGEDMDGPDVEPGAETVAGDGHDQPARSLPSLARRSRRARDARPAG